MDALVARRVQMSAPGNVVELFDLDMSPVNAAAGVLYFYPSSNEDSAAGSVLWRGNYYTPQPVKIEGIEISTTGSMPRPKVTASNIYGQITALIQAYGRLSGAILTRWQTFDVYLDNGSQPNPDGHLPVDVFILDKIVSHNRLEVQVECRSFLDFQGVQLPARTILQGACSHTYRVPSEGSFDYSAATCPWKGQNYPSDQGPYYDAVGNSTNAAGDDCGRKLSDCRLRFGNSPLPTRAFPGVGRF